MDRKDLISLLKPVIPTVLYGWYCEGNEPKRPYGVLNYLYPDFVYADNIPIIEFHNWQLDFIADRKSESIEKQIEQLFRDNQIIFNKREDSSVGNYVRVIYSITTQ